MLLGMKGSLGCCQKLWICLQLKMLSLFRFFPICYCRWNIIFRYCGIYYWYSEFAAYPTTRPPHFSPPGLLVWVLKGSSDLGDVLYLVGSFWVLKDAGWMCRFSCLYTHTCIHWMWSCCDPSNKPSLVTDY